MMILLGSDLQWAAEMTYFDEPIDPPHMWPAGTSEQSIMIAFWFYVSEKNTKNLKTYLSFLFFETLAMGIHRLRPKISSSFNLVVLNELKFHHHHDVNRYQWMQMNWTHGLIRWKTSLIAVISNLPSWSTTKQSLNQYTVIRFMDEFKW